MNGPVVSFVVWSFCRRPAGRRAFWEENTQKSLKFGVKVAFLKSKNLFLWIPGEGGDDRLHSFML